MSTTTATATRTTSTPASIPPHRASTTLTTTEMATASRVARRSVAQAETRIAFNGAATASRPPPTSSRCHPKSATASTTTATPSRTTTIGVDESTASTWYLDADDGWGAGEGIDTCTPPTGHVEDNTDCDDTDREVFGPGLWVTDGDGDGYGTGDTTGPASCEPPAANLVSEYLPEDCEDGDDSIYPTALGSARTRSTKTATEDLPCITYLYTINTSTDTLQAISLETRTIEDIGPIGFDIQFGDLTLTEPAETCT